MTPNGSGRRGAGRRAAGGGGGGTADDGGGGHTGGQTGRHTGRSGRTGRPVVDRQAGRQAGGSAHPRPVGRFGRAGRRAAMWYSTVCGRVLAPMRNDLCRPAPVSAAFRSARDRGPGGLRHAPAISIQTSGMRRLRCGPRGHASRPPPPPPPPSPPSPAAHVAPVAPHPPGARGHDDRRHRRRARPRPRERGERAHSSRGGARARRHGTATRLDESRPRSVPDDAGARGRRARGHRRSSV